MICFSFAIVYIFVCKLIRKYICIVHILYICVYIYVFLCICIYGYINASLILCLQAKRFTYQLLALLANLHGLNKDLIQ